MSTYILAFLIGVVVGLRCLTPLAAVSWAARLGWVHLQGTWLAFLGAVASPYVFTVLAIAEIINDKLPKTASRKAPLGFSARIISGVLCGGALGASNGTWFAGAIAGVLGGLAGTFGGYEFRARLVRATGGKDLPIALLEDAIAISSAVWIVTKFSNV